MFSAHRLIVSIAFLQACSRTPASPDPPGAPDASAAAAVAVSAPASAVSATPAAPVGPHPIWLVLTEGGNTYLELDAGRDAWGRGAPALLGDATSVTAVRRDVDAARAPEAHRALIGQRVTLFDLAGKPCPGEVTGLELLERILPDDALDRSWAGVDTIVRPEDPTLARSAKKVWARESRGCTLAARVTARCEAPLWAQPAGLPAPAVASFEPAQGALARAAEGALHALPVFAQVGAFYAKRRRKADPARLEDVPNYGEGFEVATTPDGQAMVHAGMGVCLGNGHFTVNLEAFWRVSGPPESPTLMLLGTPAPRESLWVQSAVDLDGDGQLDVLTLDGFLLARDGALSPPTQQRARLAGTCPEAGPSEEELARVR